MLGHIKTAQKNIINEILILHCVNCKSTTKQVVLKRGNVNGLTWISVFFLKSANTTLHCEGKHGSNLLQAGSRAHF